VDQDAYDDLLQRLTALVIKLDSTYDALMASVEELKEGTREQREFNRQQVAINQRLETLLERAWRSSTNGHTD
jgi:exonuclease VII small subunit